MAQCSDCKCKGLETQYSKGQIETLQKEDLNETKWPDVDKPGKKAGSEAVAKALDGKVDQPKGEVTWAKDKSFKEFSDCKSRKKDSGCKNACTCKLKGAKQSEKAWSKFEGRDFQVDFMIGRDTFHARGKLSGRERKLKVYCAPNLDTAEVVFQSFEQGASIVLASGREIPPETLRVISAILTEDALKGGSQG